MKTVKHVPVNPTRKDCVDTPDRLPAKALDLLLSDWLMVSYTTHHFNQ